jgi:predicted transcriptional regulator YdeE
MRGPTLIDSPPKRVVGMNFFGDPFSTSAGWTEENEIGRLWTRMMSYWQAHGDAIRHVCEPQVMLEIHIWNEVTRQTGEFDVFVGVEVAELEALPVDLLVKLLPSTLYAVFTLEGEEITRDWPQGIYQEWMSAAGYRSAHPYMIQRYDTRFKGLDQLEGSELDVLIPVVHVSPYARTLSPC